VLKLGGIAHVLCYRQRAMTTVFAQGAVEYVGAAGGATSAISVLGEQFSSVLNTVSLSVSDHPMLWGAGLCVAVWMLFRRK